VKSQGIDLSITIPFYNEGENVRLVVTHLVSEFEKEEFTYELVLVNNGSSDKTGQLISEMIQKYPCVKAIHIEQNQGYGGGILTGLENCSGRYIGYVWGDEQVLAKDVVHVFKKLQDEKLDLCKANRIIRHDGLKRKIISRVYNRIFSLFFPVNTTDVNGCPKIFKRERYDEFQIGSRDWFIDAEIMIKSQRLHFKIGEVPIVFYQRKSGTSNVRFSTILEFIRNLCKYKVKGI
jgi:glycosyltransferase involved in cell wall biosynthesis